ncbi:MAG TPA: endonuclease [Pantanalinema sp.]
MLKKSVLIALGLATALAGCALPSGLSTAGGSTGSKARASGIPAEYYAKAQTAEGQQLLAALHAIVTPHKDLGYDQGRDLMFGSVDDLDNDNVVVGVYDGTRRPGISDRGSASSKDMNAEHTWPQSKGATNAAKADLHHLFPADMELNARRGSYPFGEVLTPTYVTPEADAQGEHSRLGPNAGGKIVFEPRPSERGNVARALLYFYTCYAVKPTSVNVSLDNFRVELPVILKWHQQDPVDAAERDRNDAVYEVQKNRNPYVDHPEYVAKIGAGWGL